MYFTMFGLLKKKLFHFSWKRIRRIVGGSMITSFYFYKKHLYEKEMLDQYKYLLENNIKISNVYIQQRQAFPLLWYIQWLIPYHQSIKIVKPDGTIRHIGLAKSPHPKNFWDFTSEFVSHLTPAYAKLNTHEQSIPVECCVDFKRAFGHFPTDLDLEKLDQITMTRAEAKDLKLDPDKVIYKTIFGSVFKGLHGRWVMSTCQYAVMQAIRKAEREIISEPNYADLEINEKEMTVDLDCSKVDYIALQ